MIQQIKPIVEVKQYIECPYCQKGKSRIDHLFNQRKQDYAFGPWHCEECRESYKGIVKKDNSVFIEKIDEPYRKSLVFLRLDNILFVVRSSYTGELNYESEKYIYEEHMCPSSIMNYVEEIVHLDNKEIDPHGIFTFIGVMPDFDIKEVDNFEALLSELEKNSSAKNNLL